jgi:molybdopterin synthase catalytic subunit
VTSPAAFDTPAAKQPHGDDWVGLSSGPLPVAAAGEWAVLPRCGAVVTFTGTVRDQAEGREGVTHLHYEAYEDQVAPRLAALATEIRRRWPDVGRVVLLHRSGEVCLTEAAVIVVVSAPHREVAFDAARFGIDALKATVPIWKREHTPAGEAWGSGARTIASVEELG